MSRREAATRKRIVRIVAILFFLSMVGILLYGGFVFYDTVVLEYTAKPEIWLNGDAVETIEVFSDYNDPGADATVRGRSPMEEIETSGEVNTEAPGEYKIYYKIKNDKGKNEEQVERTILVVDSEAPVITLVGNNPLALTVGTSYTEPGAKASDNVDGDLSAAIEMEGTVDTAVPGEYQIIYRVRDSSGNLAEVVRNIKVNAPLPPSGNGKTVYLTFDDGPSNLTAGILDTLKAYNAKATFFVIGTHLDAYADILKRAVAEGHTIALHSNTHNYGKIYTSEEAFWNDIETLNSRVEKIIGRRCTILRFPGGTSNTVSRQYNVGIMGRLLRQAHQRGYKVYDWNITSGDAESKGASADTIAANVIAGMRVNYATPIALMHDAGAKKTTAAALEQILIYGKNYGYTFAAMGSNTTEVIHRVNN